MREFYDNTIHFIKDLWWWATDRKPEWEDAIPCNKKLCRICGNYPFKSLKDK